MTIRDLRKFGILRKVFRGKGIIYFIDGSEYPARFILAQRVDGQLLISADINISFINFVNEKKEVQSLTGTILDGRPIRTSGPIIPKAVNPIPHTNKLRLIAYPSNWICGSTSFNGPASLSFDLVNFCFLGTKYNVVSANSVEQHTLSLMPLTLGNRNILLRQVPDYDQVEATLKALRGVEVTCTATTSLDNPSEMEEVVSTLETLSDVMSVARATLITWISYEVATLDGVPVYSQYRNSVTRSYAGMDLIHRNDPHQTKTFLEKGFLRWNDLNEDFQIRKIARAYTETRDGPFIESRSLLIAVLAEYLSGVRARLDNHVFFLEEGIFSAGWETLKDEMRVMLQAIYPDTNKIYAKAMLGNIKGSLNRRSLSWRLNDLAKFLNLKFERGEVDKFVETRNKLAHEGTFPEDGTPAKHYMRMQHFLDRILLRLFDYHGSYLDFEHNEIRQI